MHANTHIYAHKHAYGCGYMHMRRAIHVLRRVYVHVACSYAYKQTRIYMGITMHMDMHICIYDEQICIQTRIYAHKHAYGYGYMHMRRALHVLRRAYVHVACSYAYKHAYMGITMHMDMHICMYDRRANMHANTHIYAHKHAYGCGYMHI